MSDLADFSQTDDVSDAAIEWVLRESGGVDCPWTVRSTAKMPTGSTSRARIIAARLIQQHRPDLLVDPVDAIVREELGKAWDQNGMSIVAKSIRAGKNDTDTMFRAAKRLYLMGKEAGK